MKNKSDAALTVFSQRRIVVVEYSAHDEFGNSFAGYPVKKLSFKNDLQLRNVENRRSMIAEKSTNFCLGSVNSGIFFGIFFFIVEISIFPSHRLRLFLERLSDCLRDGFFTPICVR